MTSGSSAKLRPLEGLNGERPDAPDWYRALELAPSEVLFPLVDGAAIEVLAWGDPGLPGVLLAHGNRAHARWWGPIAPLLARHYRVVSLSYSGMGGSEWRSAYSVGQQVEELFAAAKAGLLFAGEKPPVFVGHSFGARAIAAAMQSRGAELTGAILVDSVIMVDRLPAFLMERRDPRYSSLAEALSRFNLRPSQDCANLFLLDEVARAGLEEASDGWRWRFDPDYYRKYTVSKVWPPAAELSCRLAFVYGEESETLDAAQLADQKRQAPGGTAFVGIPNAGHHVMLDQPLALTAALRALLECWFNSAD